QTNANSELTSAICTTLTVVLFVLLRVSKSSMIQVPTRQLSQASTSVRTKRRPRFSARPDERDTLRHKPREAPAEREAADHDNQVSLVVPPRGTLILGISNRVAGLTRVV